MAEQTLVILKPDTVKRGLIGKILTRFEDSGLKIAAMKMISADESLAKDHYQLNEEWAKQLYVKTKAFYDKEGKKFPYKDSMDLGTTIQNWNLSL